MFERKIKLGSREKLEKHGDSIENGENATHRATEQLKRGMN